MSPNIKKHSRPSHPRLSDGDRSVADRIATVAGEGAIKVARGFDKSDHVAQSNVQRYNSYHQELKVEGGVMVHESYDRQQADFNERLVALASANTKTAEPVSLSPKTAISNADLVDVNADRHAYNEDKRNAASDDSDHGRNPLDASGDYKNASHDKESRDKDADKVAANKMDAATELAALASARGFEHSDASAANNALRQHNAGDEISVESNALAHENYDNEQEALVTQAAQIASVDAKTAKSNGDLAGANADKHAYNEHNHNAAALRGYARYEEASIASEMSADIEKRRHIRGGHTSDGHRADSDAYQAVGDNSDHGRSPSDDATDASGDHNDANHVRSDAIHDEKPQDKDADKVAADRMDAAAGLAALAATRGFEVSDAAEASALADYHASDEQPVESHALSNKNFDTQQAALISHDIQIASMDAKTAGRNGDFADANADIHAYGEELNDEAALKGYARDEANIAQAVASHHPKSSNGNYGSGDAGFNNNGSHDLGDGNDGSGNFGDNNTGNNNFGSNNHGNDNHGNNNWGNNNWGNDDWGNNIHGNNIHEPDFGPSQPNDGEIRPHHGVPDPVTPPNNEPNDNWGQANNGHGNHGSFNHGDHNDGFYNGPQNGYPSGNENHGKNNHGNGNFGNDNTGNDNHGNDNHGNNNWGNNDRGNDDRGNNDFGNNDYGNNDHGDNDWGNNIHGNNIHEPGFGPGQPNTPSTPGHHNGPHHNGPHHNGPHHNGPHHNGPHHNGPHHNGPHHNGPHHNPGGGGNKPGGGGGKGVPTSNDVQKLESEVNHDIGALERNQYENPNDATTGRNHVPRQTIITEGGDYGSIGGQVGTLETEMQGDLEAHDNAHLKEHYDELEELEFNDGPTQQPYGGIHSQYEGLCFASGTLIKTVDGDRTVESLKIGDIVITASGERKPIKWIGFREMYFASNDVDKRNSPVCIEKDALSDNVPYKPLYVSPAHALGFDARIKRIVGGYKTKSVMIRAGALVNDLTIHYVPTRKVSYWHVELDQHDFLVANGAKAESFQDKGERASFTNGATIELQTPSTSIDAVVPRVKKGPYVRSVRSEINKRAKLLAHKKQAGSEEIA